MATVLGTLDRIWSEDVMMSVFNHLDFNDVVNWHRATYIPTRHLLRTKSQPRSAAEACFEWNHTVLSDDTQ